MEISAAEFLAILAHEREGFENSLQTAYNVHDAELKDAQERISELEAEREEVSAFARRNQIERETLYTENIGLREELARLQSLLNNQKPQPCAYPVEYERYRSEVWQQGKAAIGFHEWVTLLFNERQRLTHDLYHPKPSTE